MLDAHLANNWYSSGTSRHYCIVYRANIHHHDHHFHTTTIASQKVIDDGRRENIYIFNCNITSTTIYKRFVE